MKITEPGWFIPWHCLNQLQKDSIEQLVKLARSAHFIDIKMRINGKDEWFQADWIKSLVYTGEQK